MENQYPRNLTFTLVTACILRPACREQSRSVLKASSLYKGQPHPCRRLKLIVKTLAVAPASYYWVYLGFLFDKQQMVFSMLPLKCEDALNTLKVDLFSL